MHSPLHLVTCQTSLWLPQQHVGEHLRWAEVCGAGLESALSYLRETEPLTFALPALTDRGLSSSPLGVCKNERGMQVTQSAHSALVIAYTPLSAPYISFPHTTDEPEQPRSALPHADTLIEPLSERELEVLSLLSFGYKNDEIARRLVVAVSTIKWHLKHIYQKLGVHTRTQAVAYARAMHILS